MNTTLQQRIEEAARNYASYLIGEDQNQQPLIDIFIRMATFVLQNQWISVEEALPEEDFNDGYRFVFVRIKINEDTFIFDSDYIRNKKWELHPNANVTHWMEIPSMKGAEK